MSLSEERHRALAELVSGYSYAHRLEPDGTIIREWVLPEAYSRVTGYSEHDLYPLDDPSTRGRLIYPDDLPIWQRRIQNMLSGNPDASEFRIVPNDRLNEGWELTYKVAHGQQVQTETTRRRQDGSRLNKEDSCL